MRDSRGYTLLEILVALAIFAVVAILASTAFQKVAAISGVESRSMTSNIEGIVGLELMRYDVEHAGYGLPWRFQNYTGAIQFRNLGGSANREVDVADGALTAGVDSGSLNAVTSTNIQPLSATTGTKEVDGQAVTNIGGGPDYLVMRSVLADLNRGSGQASRKWSYVNYSTSATSNLSYLKRWNNGEDFAVNDRLITVLSTFTPAGAEEKVLLMNGIDFEVPLPASGALPTGNAFKPADPSNIVVAYGIMNSASGAAALRMPYHRTDYFLSRPAKMPAVCNPGTGILYKAVASQASGGFDPPYPLLNCVGDLQVEFEYDANDDGNLSYLPPEALTALSAAEIRSHLKNVRIYLLTHDGKKDSRFSYPGGAVQVGDLKRPATSGRTWSSSDMTAHFGADWRTYRWKIYTIVTRPKNLIQ